MTECLGAEWISAVSGAVAALIATGALVVAARQLGRQSRTAQAQFFLALDDAFRLHSETHTKLRPPVPNRSGPTGAVGSWWGATAEGPATGEDWVAVEAYMGLFERINVMVDQGLLEIDTVKRLYGYRVRNIWANSRIAREKLEKGASGVAGLHRVDRKARGGRRDHRRSRG